ncbi:P-loop containing nucleoside triphosphate hydrolase protein [Pholiota molesta]|nr:P-loop containing nucleoside triphosphate hydrolase protein [Pholiota molesta]
MEAKALGVLRRLVGNPTADWSCPEQKTGVLAALSLQRDVIAVLATGLGKTMLAILPSLLEHQKMTVVLLPLRSLMADYEHKLTRLQVPFEVFTGGRIHGEANLLLVSADISKADSWRHEAAILNERKPIVRIVFDEAHIPLLSANYRPALRDMFLLHSLPAGVQIILLSATLSHALVPTLIREFGLSGSPLVLRTNTNRPELQYIWRAPSSSQKIIEQAVKIAQDYQWSHERERGLVFVPFYDMGQRIATQLNCDFYSGNENTTNEERHAMYNRWNTGAARVMVCTSAFGTGNDYSHTRFVVHAGRPYEMVNYIQEISRAGRDKVPSMCILLPQVKDAPGEFPTPDFGGFKAMHEALQAPDGCVRFKITSHTDAVGTACADNAGNQLCNFCQTRYAASIDGVGFLANIFTIAKSVVMTFSQRRIMLPKEGALTPTPRK